MSEAREIAVKAAREKWAKAPAHIKALAAAYVDPLFSALEALATEQDEINTELQALSQALAQHEGAGHA